MLTFKEMVKWLPEDTWKQRRIRARFFMLRLDHSPTRRPHKKGVIIRYHHLGFLPL